MNNEEYLAYDRGRRGCQRTTRIWRVNDERFLFTGTYRKTITLPIPVPVSHVLPEVLHTYVITIHNDRRCSILKILSTAIAVGVITLVVISDNKNYRCIIMTSFQ